MDSAGREDMSKTSVVTTQTQEVTIAPRLARQLLTELRGYGAITVEMKALDEAKKGHSAEVLRLSSDVDADKFELDGYKVAVVKGALDRRLDKDKLIRRLIGDGKYSMKAALALMEDCTTEKPKKDHCRITVPGENNDD